MGERVEENSRNIGELSAKNATLSEKTVVLGKQIDDVDTEPIENLREHIPVY